jgi:hypothetical protein
MSFTDYLPNGLVVAVATVGAWVFRDHVARDDARFQEIANAFSEVGKKLDKAVEVQSQSHAEILRILLEQKHDK